jgi:hypothetical protein
LQLIARLFFHSNAYLILFSYALCLKTGLNVVVNKRLTMNCTKSVLSNMDIKKKLIKALFICRWRVHNRTIRITKSPFTRHGIILLQTPMTETFSRQSRLQPISGRIATHLAIKTEPVTILIKIDYCVVHRFKPP